MSAVPGVSGFDVVVRVARLALESSAEGVESLERTVASAAAAYDVDVDVDLVVLPEQIVLTERSSGEVVRVAVVRTAPGIFRLDQVAALKRLLVRMEQERPSPEEGCRLLDALSRSRPRWSPGLRVVGAALLGLLMGALVVAAAGRPLEALLPFVGAFVVTTLGLTVLSDLAQQTGVTLVVLPALLIVVPGDTLSAAAGELLGGYLTAGAVRLVSGFLTLGLTVTGIVAASEVAGRGDALAGGRPHPLRVRAARVVPPSVV